MSRGRPKGSKNKKNIVLNNISEESKVENLDVSTFVTVNEVKEKEEVKKSKIKSVGICDLCGKEIFSSLHQLNLNWLTNKATWHRDICTDKLKVCNDCATEFNNMINKYLLKKNPALNKFDIKEMTEDDKQE